MGHHHCTLDLYIGAPQWHIHQHPAADLYFIYNFHIISFSTLYHFCFLKKWGLFFVCIVKMNKIKIKKKKPKHHHYVLCCRINLLLPFKRKSLTAMALWIFKYFYTLIQNLSMIWYLMYRLILHKLSQSSFHYFLFCITLIYLIGVYVCVHI